MTRFDKLFKNNVILYKKSRKRSEYNMKSQTLKRLKHTAKLESLIAQEADYNKILKQSQRIDKYIVEEMIRINDHKDKEK